jgi:hypothetical protein
MVNSKVLNAVKLLNKIEQYSIVAYSCLESNARQYSARAVQSSLQKEFNRLPKPLQVKARQQWYTEQTQTT